MRKEVIKFINDTMKPKGRYELKRALAVHGFHLGLLYIFIPCFYPDFKVHEFVVLTIFGFVAACIGIAVNEKIKMNKDDNNGTIG